MRRGTTSTSQRPISVRFLDPATGKSISITVYGADLLDVARQAEADLANHWRITAIDDRRHHRWPS